MSRNRRTKARRNVRQIALERISILFEKAEEVLTQDPDLGQRYVSLAREIGMHYKVRIPFEYRKMICRRCKGFILPGVNCRVRTQSRREPHIVVTCLNCGGQTRIPLKKRDNNGYAEAKVENQERDG